MTTTSIVATRPTIPALPPSLQVIPSWLDHPEDPQSDEWRRKWPIYAENLKDFREYATKKARTDSAYRQAQILGAAEDPAYFLAVYGWIFEPRDTDLGDPGWYPWCPFPHQVLALRQMQQAWVSKKPRSDIVWEKSRDMGATWLAMGWCLHQWLFSKAFTAGLVSFREDAVDDGTPDSMFFKLRGMLGVLEYGENLGVPYWMRPDGYIPQIHGRRLKLNHPRKTCVIRGESTTARGGTGARNTMRVNDEAAKHELFRENLASQRATTNHILSLSSAYVAYGTDFKETAEDARLAEDALDRGQPNDAQGPRYYRMEWWMHPFHDQEWRAAEEAGYASKEAFAREVLIDYRAGNTNLVYAEEAERVPLVPEGDDPANDLLITIDPGLRDDTAIVFVNAWGDVRRPKVRWVDVYETNGKPTAYFAHLLTGIPPVPGDVCHSFYTFGDREQEIMAWMLQNWLSGREMRFVMDPAGAQKTLAAMSNTIQREDNDFPTQLRNLSGDLRHRYHAEHGNCPPPWGIYIAYKHLYASNRFPTRRANLRAIMADSEITDRPGGHRLLKCWITYRFQERTREATTDPKPAHDEYSHVVTASEFGASDLIDRGRPGGLDAGNRKTQRPRGAQRERKVAA